MSQRLASSAIGTGLPPGRAPRRASSASAWIAYLDLELMVINAETPIDQVDLSLKRLVSLFLPPLTVMGLIFLLSGQTADPHHPWWQILFRKLAHVTEYFVLTLAWWRALRGLAPDAPLGQLAGAAGCISLLYAATDEFHQTFVGGRHGTPVDVLIDSIGIGLVCWLISSQARRRRRTAGPSRPRAA